MEEWILTEIIGFFENYCKSKNYNRFFMKQLHEVINKFLNDEESFNKTLQKITELEKKFNIEKEELSLNLAKDNIQQQYSCTIPIENLEIIPRYDNINKPKHYNKTEHDLFDCCKYGLVPKEEYESYIKLNIFKYLLRYKDKNGLEDLQKAEKHLQELININKE